ncbi:MAG: GNAT family N-acetyltransferase [Verrucomicrobia bacterium]|nr:GNAT family N-acetyltransferase [Verrucomicrobiota bacterium]
MSPGVIRDARESDSAALAGLFTELGYPSTPADIGERLPQVIGRAEQRVLVADDHAVIGCLQVVTAVTLELGRHAQIVGLVVAATHRRKGIGRALVAAAEEWAAQQGCPRMLVRTNTLRAAAPGFYSGIGYTVAKTQYAFVKPLPSGQR